MDPGAIIGALTFLAIAGMVAAVVVKIARLHAARAGSLPADVTERIEALEHGLQSMQQDLAETQERLDFAERLLTKVREERRIDG